MGNATRSNRSQERYLVAASRGYTSRSGRRNAHCIPGMFLRRMRDALSGKPRTGSVRRRNIVREWCRRDTTYTSKYYFIHQYYYYCDLGVDAGNRRAAYLAVESKYASVSRAALLVDFKVSYSRSALGCPEQDPEEYLLAFSQDLSTTVNG